MAVNQGQTSVTTSPVSTRLKTRSTWTLAELIERQLLRARDVLWAAAEAIHCQCQLSLSIRWKQAASGFESQDLSGAYTMPKVSQADSSRKASCLQRRLALANFMKPYRSVNESNVGQGPERLYTASSVLASVWGYGTQALFRRRRFDGSPPVTRTCAGIVEIVPDDLAGLKIAPNDTTHHIPARICLIAENTK
jgi:hypothetical protein